MFANYLAAALRNLARDRVNAAMTIVGLAIAFSAAILIAVFVRDEHRYDRWPNHERTYAVMYAGELIDKGPYKGRTFVDSMAAPHAAGLIKDQIPEVEAVTRIDWNLPVFAKDQVTAAEDVLLVDANFFEFFPFKTIDGDLATALAAPDGVVLTRSLARKYFGKDDVVGETLTMSWGGDATQPPEDRDFHPLRVNAVIEDLPSETHIKVAAFLSGRMANGGLDDPEAFYANAYVRLRPSADPARVEAALQPLLPRLESPHHRGKVKVELIPLAELHLSDDPRDISDGGGGASRGSMKLVRTVSALGIVIVLIAALNFVSLMTARGAKRGVEIGVRKAAGARRRDLVLQFIGEATLYAFLALILAVALAEALLPAVNRVLGRTMRFDYYADPAMAAVLVGGTLLVGVLAGAYPALVIAGFRPSLALKGAIAPSRAGKIVRQSLVAVQFAVLVGLALTAITFQRQTSHAVQAAVRLGGAPVVVADNVHCDYAMADRLAAVQGVRAVTCGRGPLTPLGPFGEALALDGSKTPLADEQVGLGFLEFYGFKPLAGRLFQASDQQAVEVNFSGQKRTMLKGGSLVVINETARKGLGFVSPQAAVGADIRNTYKGMPPVQVIGVVRDHTVRKTANPQAYSLSSPAFGLNIKLTGTDVPAALDRIDAAWRELGNLHPMKRQFQQERIAERFDDVIRLSRIVGTCAGVALFVALLGMFALSAFTAQLRTKEIGVRKALGARTSDVIILLLAQFSIPVIIGNLIAGPFAYIGLSRWLKTFGEPVGTPIWLFAAVLAASLAAAWLTVLTHALAVARRRPVHALRYE